MSLKLKPYVAAIVQSDQDEATALAPARADEAKASVNMTLAKLEIDIKRQELSVQVTAGRHPLEIGAVIEANDELDLMNRRKVQLIEVRDQLFPAA